MKQASLSWAEAASVRFDDAKSKLMGMGTHWTQMAVPIPDGNRRRVTSSASFAKFNSKAVKKMHSNMLKTMVQSTRSCESPHVAHPSLAVGKAPSQVRGLLLPATYGHIPPSR